MKITLPSKFIFKMKLTGLLMMIACIQAGAKGFSQRTITLSMKDAPLEQVLNEISLQSGFHWLGDPALLDGVDHVTVQLYKVSLNDALNASLKNTKLTFTISDNRYFVISLKSKNEAIDKHAPPPNKIDIEGTVINEDGQPLEGASIVVKGTNAGVLTNAQGRFILKGINPDAILVVSFTGYANSELQVTGKKSLFFKLKRSTNQLDETVIKGYYTTSQRFNTGDVTTVSGEDMLKSPVSDPILSLEGKVPGLFLHESSGVPGAALNIYLRGQNSIANGNAPLYVVDGIPFNSTPLSGSILAPGGQEVSPFNVLTMADIESVEILKDADATAIYGSRGANGVILINTKKGRPGQTSFDVNFYTGLGQADRMMPMLNTKQYLEMRNEAFTNDQTIPQSTDYDVNGTWDTTRYTNWEKYFIGGTSNVISGTASISGGDANTQFLLDGNYRRETTVFPGDYFDQKGSLHFNLNHTSTNQKIHLNLSASYIGDNSNMPTIDLTKNITLPPDAPPLYNGNGDLNWANNTWTNPLAALGQTGKTNSTNLLGTLSGDYLLAKGLHIRCSFGYNNVGMNQIFDYPLTSYSPAYASFTFLRQTNINSNEISTWSIEPQISYDKVIGQGKINLIIGGTYQDENQSLLTEQGSGYSSDQLLGSLLGAPTITILSNSLSQYKYDAVYARAGYNLEDKYIVNLTARRDGSSRFGPGKQFGDFGSAGFAWIFSNEAALKHILNFLSFGKLRTSFGTAGNDQIGNYQYLSTYTPNQLTYQGQTTINPTQLTNPNYGWEVVRKLEAGLELGFVQNRLLFDASYYLNKTGNQLVGYSLPTITGFSSVTANLPAVVQNTGIEVSLNMYLVRRKKFTWHSTVNLSIPRNKLVSYPNLSGSSYANLYEIGKSLFVRKIYHLTGVDPQAGIYEFATGTKDSSSFSPPYPQALQADKQVAPNYYGGFENTFIYRNWSLDILLQFVNQNSYNYLQYFQLPPGIAFNNEPTYVLQRWQHSGQIANVEEYTESYSSNAATAFFNNSFSDNIIGNASFIRVKNVVLAYSISSHSFQKLHLKDFKIYISGQNLLTFTKYQGLDPETSLGFSLPPIRMVTVGFHLSL